MDPKHFQSHKLSFNTVISLIINLMLRWTLNTTYWSVIFGRNRYFLWWSFIVPNICNSEAVDIIMIIAWCVSGDIAIYDDDVNSLLGMVQTSAFL